MNSREKGKRGEREFALTMREHGYETRRGQQYSGANGDADVVGLPHIHCEVKRAERSNLYDWIAQSKHDAREGELPAVFWRKNNSKWLVIMELDDWVEIYKEYE